MTCFWDGIINGLNLNMNAQSLVTLLKNNCVKTDSVYWNDNPITEKQMDENKERIKNFDISTINSGYDCSTFEPFLFLVSQIYRVDIKHNYNGNMITYKYIGNTDKSICNKMLYFNSDRGHFWLSGS